MCGMKYLSISKLQRCNRWSLVMDKWFHPSLSWTYDYLSVLLIKGSNMIVCVLLVSNSRGCCLAAPGDHEGAVLWRQRSWSCGVFKSWISDAHSPFQWKWQVLHSYDTSVVQQVSVFCDGIACLMKVWPLFKREFPRVPMTWRSARARISNVTS